MKFLIRSFLTVAAGLFITSWVIPGFSVSTDPMVLLTITTALVLANWFVKPLLKIVFLPLNLASFGLFSLVINAIILYGIHYFFTGITVSSWTFPGYEYSGFSIPVMTFGIIVTYLIAGLIIGITTTIVHWLVAD